MAARKTKLNNFQSKK